MGKMALKMNKRNKKLNFEINTNKKNLRFSRFIYIFTKFISKQPFWNFSSSNWVIEARSPCHEYMCLLAGDLNFRRPLNQCLGSGLGYFLVLGSELLFFRALDLDCDFFKCWIRIFKISGSGSGMWYWNHNPQHCFKHGNDGSRVLCLLNFFLGKYYTFHILCI